MIGIDPTLGRSVLAVYREEIPEVVGNGKTLEDLIAFARSSLNSGFEESMTVIAVPAWYHDEQRLEVVKQARSAGLELLRLINRPAAVALAYSILKPAERSTMMVIELDDKHFDVSVITLASGGVKILATDGISDLDTSITSMPEKFYDAIEASLHRALKDAAITSESLDEILLSGQIDSLKGMNQQISNAFGIQGSTHVKPDHAVALGSAVYAKLIEMGLNEMGF